MFDRDADFRNCNSALRTLSGSCYISVCDICNVIPIFSPGIRKIDFVTELAALTIPGGKIFDHGSTGNIKELQQTKSFPPDVSARRSPLIFGRSFGSDCPFTN